MNKLFYFQKFILSIAAIKYSKLKLLSSDKTVDLRLRVSVSTLLQEIGMEEFWKKIRIKLSLK